MRIFPIFEFVVPALCASSSIRGMPDVPTEEMISVPKAKLDALTAAIKGLSVHTQTALATTKIDSTLGGCCAEQNAGRDAIECWPYLDSDCAAIPGNSNAMAMHLLPRRLQLVAKLPLE